VNTSIEPLDFSTLNPGIRGIVRLLRALGLNTTDSGDGVTNVAAGMEFALDVPHVHCTLPASHPDPFACAKVLAQALRAAGLPVTSGTIQLTFDPEDGSTVLSIYGLDDKMLVG
jgi:hypothetical protein